MPFNSVGNRLERVWAFVDQFEEGDTADRADLDVAINDVVDGVNTALGYLEDLNIAATASNLYLGRQGSVPTLNLDGDPLVAGNFYVLSTDGVLYVYSGSAWVREGDLAAASTFFKTLVTQSTAAAFRAAIGLGSASVLPSTSFLSSVGNVLFGGEARLADDKALFFGTDDDLWMMHDGAVSTLSSEDWPLEILSDLITLKNGAGTETLAIFTADAGATFSFNNVVKLAVVTGGVTVSGTVTTADMVLGATSELSVNVASGAVRLITAAGTDFVIRTEDFFVRSQDGLENMIAAVENGAATLYHNNVAKIATSAGGVTVTGAITGDTVAGSMVADATAAKAMTSTTQLVTPAGLGAARNQFMHVREVQSAGTAGGTNTAGAWTIRVLNTELLNSITGASLASNQITLPAGTYRLTATAPFQDVDGAAIRLYDTTAAAVIRYGTSQGMSSATVNAVANLTAVFALAGTSVLEVQYYTKTAKTTVGLGAAANMTIGEVYTDVLIQRIA